MARFIKGDIVVVPFPFTDLSASKKRPALVLADLPGDDIILCQITSQQVKDVYAINLTESDMVSSSLKNLAIFGQTGYLQQIKILSFTK